MQYLKAQELISLLRSMIINLTMITTVSLFLEVPFFSSGKESQEFIKSLVYENSTTFLKILIKKFEPITYVT